MRSMHTTHVMTAAAAIAAGVQILTDIDNIIYVGKYNARMCEITKTI